MELGKSDKLFLYLTGFVKLVELFRDRTESLQTETDQWMLYIYCDNMFFEDGGFKNSDYTFTPERNNENNIKIKGFYAKNQEFFKRLLQLYREYLAIITANEENKYSFVKLFSYNCMDVKNEKPYLGHPSTFGSFIRFLPFFDDLISRVFSINIRSAITPKLIYEIKEWVESQKELITINMENYYFKSAMLSKDKTEQKKISIIRKYLEINKKKTNLCGVNQINTRHAAGLIGFYKKQSEAIIDVNINFFMNIIKKIIKLQKKK